MFDIFKKWYDERHEYQKKWKEIKTYIMKESPSRKFKLYIRQTGK